MCSGKNMLRFGIIILSTLVLEYSCRFEPNWESLDKHVSPKWYDEAKIGVMMHWGVYAVPSFGSPSEWLWNFWKTRKHADTIKYMKDNYPPNFQYADFAPSFKAEFFNPQKWADLIEESGAKYFVITSKHHEGFTLWRSNVSWNWNAVDNGPHRDILAELSDAIRSKKDIHFGLYYSLFEWYHPLFLYDKANNFKTQEYVKKVMNPQMYDYVTRYKPEYIWSDGDPASPEYFNSTEFIAWLYNDSPVRDMVLVNDRWGYGTSCKHGDVKTCADRFNPGHPPSFKYENAMTIDKYSWGYRRNARINEFMTMFELTALLAKTVSFGGNLLMNIGPESDGTIAPIFQERLRQMGAWLKVNGEAIFATRPWRIQNDTAAARTWYTSNSDAVYAIVLDWPADNFVLLTQPVPTDETQIFLLGHQQALSWLPPPKGGMLIDVSSIGVTTLPCQWAWSFKLVNVH